jgi:ABC-2 type transport system permease protein
LILTLILGPFVIMLLFGLAYRREARSLRTVFVVPQNSSLTAQVQKFGETLGPAITYEGIVNNEEVALKELNQNKVDLVVVVPPHPMETIQNNHQVMLQLYDHEIDPFQVSYVKYVGGLYVDALNRRILLSTIQQSQKETAPLQKSLQAAQKSAQAYHQALAQSDSTAAAAHKKDLNQNLSALQAVLGSGLDLLQGMGNTFTSGNDSNNTSNQNDINQIMNSINQSMNLINSSAQSNENTQQKEQQTANIENNLSKLSSQLSDFRKMDPVVLVSPFTSDTHTLTGVQLTPTGYFSPAVIVLLLQHLFVTFAGLSIVRERRAGTMELFKASPISSLEILLGKYASYLAFGVFVAAVLTVLVVWGLGVPMLGTWLNYAVLLLVLLFTSLSAGFLISLISENDTQSVQYAMLLLLASIFFSGFFLNLDSMWPPMKTFSYILPATYAIHILHEVMLRGHPIPILYILGITGIGVVIFFLDWIILHRKMSID